MGLLFDDKGNRFTPSNSAKNGRRYRYYVSQAVIRKKKDSHSISRLPAQEMEDLVISRLQALLGSAQRLIDVLGQVSDPRETASIVEASREWAKASKDRLQKALILIVTQIVVRDRGIELLVSRSKLRDLLLPERQLIDQEETDRKESISIIEQVNFEKHRGEIQLVLPGDDNSKNPRTEPALIKALARAHDWMDRILRGDILNQQAIAHETGLDKRYVSNILKLAFLAPDITEAILEGRQPPQMTLDVCLRQLPADWQMQRDLLIREVGAPTPHL